jgi:hypothetical protein
MFSLFGFKSLKILDKKYLTPSELEVHGCITGKANLLKCFIEDVGFGCMMIAFVDICVISFDYKHITCREIKKNV